MAVDYDIYIDGKNTVCTKCEWFVSKEGARPVLVQRFFNPVSDSVEECFGMRGKWHAPKKSLDKLCDEFNKRANLIYWYTITAETAIERSRNRGGRAWRVAAA